MYCDETKKQIKEKAYQLWEQDDRPQGMDLSHWLQAEAEVLGNPAIGKGHEIERQESSATDEDPDGKSEAATQ